MKDYIITLDQGTTSSRTMLVDSQGNSVATLQREFPQIFPKPGWVEHNPKDIIDTQLGTFAELLVKENISASDIAAIGITNQRETTVIWDRKTGEPVYNAIVWQCRRTTDIIEDLCGESEIKEMIQSKTGLMPDAYFSASKIKWILDNVDGVRQRADAGELAFGTIDSYLIYTLTSGQVHATDPTNASRTMLYNIHTCQWDKDLLKLFDIPESLLPEVRPSSGDFGVTSDPVIPCGIPICGVAGDQQSALFGQCCFDSGQAKNTYGTGCFLLMHTGTKACTSTHGLVTTIAASAPDKKETEYALEGSVFISGSLIQWLRDGLKIIDNAAQTEEMALSVPDTGGVYIVPAFTGLGAPYWDSDARGAIYGITRGTTREHIARAALQALAFQLNDLATAMMYDAEVSIDSLNVDGGASANNYLMQFQSDILGSQIRRPKNIETTALGAAYLAGLYCGMWKNTEELKNLRSSDDVFQPLMASDKVQDLLSGWEDAIKRTLMK